MKPKMTILNAGQNLFVRGGSDRYLLSLSKLLGEHGHRVIPFAASHPDNIETPWAEYFPTRVDFQSPTVRDVARFVYSMPAKRQLGRLLSRSRIDIAHLHIYYGQLTASILGTLRKHDIPIVQTLHEYKLVCPTYAMTRHGKPCGACQGRAFWNCLRHRCNRDSLSRSLLSTVESYVSLVLGAQRHIDRFICVSDYQRNVLVDMGAPRDKLLTVHNYIDPAGFSDTDSDGSYVLYFGRIERVKGVFGLIEAFSHLTDIPLLIVGDGTALDEAKADVEGRGLDNVRILGFRGGSQLDALISACRLAVIPSEWPETFGLTILETFAKGRPVVASRIGGIPEVVDDGVDGVLVTPGNPNGLASAIRELWGDPARCRRMGSLGQQKARTKFGPEVHYERLMRIYESVLQD